jgi:L-fucose mutarotase
MLKGKLIHPEILRVLGRAGHSSKVLIADGNYPAATKRPSTATLVSLNLSPGVVSCVDVLESLVAAIPIEAALVMKPEPSGPYGMGGNPEIWDAFRAVLLASGTDVELKPVERFNFYEISSRSDVALVIATGEQRLYANLLLTIGVVKPQDKLTGTASNHGELA